MDFVRTFGFSNFETRNMSKPFFIIINMFVFFLIHALIVLVVVELKKKSASFGDEWKVRAGLIWYLTIWYSFAGRYVLLLTEMHALICTITSLVYYRFCHGNNYHNYFSCHTWAAFAFFLFIYCFSQDICFQYVHCTDLQLKPFISLLEAVER